MWQHRGLVATMMRGRDMRGNTGAAICDLQVVAFGPDHCHLETKRHCSQPKCRWPKCSNPVFGNVAETVEKHARNTSALIHQE